VQHDGLLDSGVHNSINGVNFVYGYQWYRVDAVDPESRCALQNNASVCNGGTATASGVSTPSLTLSGLGSGDHGVYACVITNGCFTVSQGASLAIAAACNADFNNDNFLDFTDFDDFVVAFEDGLASADYNGDAFIDFTDFDDFVTDFEAGCC